MARKKKMNAANFFDKEGILNIAKERNVEEDALFIQCLKNYEVVELAIGKIYEIINSDEVLISKEYVKGRENVYIHPALKELSKLLDSANKTIDKIYLTIEKASGTPYNNDVNEILDFLQENKIRREKKSFERGANF